MNQLFRGTSRNFAVFYLSLLIVFCLTTHPGHGLSSDFQDSMAYDDIIRDVPKTLRIAHDKGFHFGQSESITVFPTFQSLKDRVEKMVKALRSRGYDTGLIGALGNSSSGLSDRCKVHLDIFLEALFHGKLWALKVLDAWGKPHSGLLQIHIRSFGDYYQCKSVVAHNMRHRGGDNVTVKGLYCMATLTIYEDITDVVDVSIQEGLCVPDGCSQTDIRLLLNELLAVTNSTQYFTSHRVSCHPGHSPDGLAIFGLSVFGLLLLIAGIATLVDFMSEEKKVEKNYQGYEGDTTVSSNGVSVNSHFSKHISSNHVVSSEYQRLSSVSSDRWNVDRNSFKVKLLLCFSMKTNFEKLFDTTPNKTDAMECIHGLRFFTMCWIIMGHTILLTAKRAENYVSYAKIVAPYFFYQIYYNSTFACDSFLCFSGILVCYNLMHTLKYFKGKMRWHLFYIYRYMRLTPAMGFVMLLYASTFQYWNEGPVWEYGGVEPGRCRHTWWHNMLYINNFFHDQCMGWLWYLAVDTQLYAISPIFAVALYKKPRFGIVLLCTCMAVSLIVTGFVVHDLHLPPTSVSVLADNLTAKADPMVNYYYAPYCRLSPYIIGMLTGYLFYVTDRKMCIPRTWQIVGWSLVLPSSFLIVFGLYRATLLNPDLVPVTLTQAVLYSTLSRPAWGLIVCWVIVVCVTGHGGLLNSVLTWRPLVPLARTTYTAYMIHVIVQLWWLLSREKPVTITDSGVFLMFFGYVLMTYLIAIPASLLFEAPIMGLQRTMIERHERKKQLKDTTTAASSPSTSTSTGAVHD